MNRCTSCNAGFAAGLPLISYRAKWPLLTRLTNRQAIENERLRAQSEHQSHWHSWAADCRGDALVLSATDSSRYAWNLGQIIDRHRALLNKYQGDISKFLFAAPLKLAKKEGEYSWQYQQALDRELDDLLAGVTANLTIWNACSVRFLARTNDFVGAAYSRDFLRAELLQAFANNRSTPRPSFQLTLDYARRLTGEEFEQWLFRLLTEAGISNTFLTQASRDQGADLLVSIGTRRSAIQAKQYGDTVGNKAVQEVLAGMQYYQCTDGWVVTTSTFSRDAIDLASRTGVQLVEGSQLLEFPRLLANFGRQAAYPPTPVSPAYGLHAPSAAEAAVSTAEALSQHHVASESQRAPIEDRSPGQKRSLFLGAAIAATAGFAWFAGSPSKTPAQVRSVVDKWQQPLVASSLDAHMNCYAQVVSPYFGASRASRNQISTDKRKALARYESINVSVADMVFETAEDTLAIVRFQKSWKASGVAGTYEGSETARLHFRRIAGKWLISGEEEVKVHWTRKSAG